MQRTTASIHLWHLHWAILAPMLSIIKWYHCLLMILIRIGGWYTKRTNTTCSGRFTYRPKLSNTKFVETNFFTCLLVYQTKRKVFWQHIFRKIVMKWKTSWDGNAMDQYQWPTCLLLLGALFLHSYLLYKASGCCHWRWIWNFLYALYHSSKWKKR